MFLSSLCSICIPLPPANSSLITSFPSPSICVHMRCIPLWRVSPQFTEVSHLRQTFFRFLPEFFLCVCYQSTSSLLSLLVFPPSGCLLRYPDSSYLYSPPTHLTSPCFVLFFLSHLFCSVLFPISHSLVFFLSHAWNSERILELRHKIA